MPHADGSPQQAAFTSTVARVRVDVIVTDRQGRFVDDLRPDEFILYEDEVEQEVLGTQIVDLARGTVVEYVGGAAAGRDDARSAPAARPSTRPVASAASRDFGALIFLVDLPGLDRRNKDRFARAWLEVLESSAMLGVPRAVYMIDQVGQLRELAPLSMSADALRRAAEEVLAAPLVRQGIHARLLRVAADALADDTLDFVGPQATDLNEIRATEAEESARSRATLELLTQFCNALSAREGRTALVWVSSEILVAEGGPGTALVAAYVEGSDGVQPGTVDRSRRTGDTLFSYLAIDSRTSVLQRELHRAANSANVSIYTLDPTPEYEHRALPIDVKVASPALTELMDSTTVQTSLDSLKDAFREAADATGGSAAISATELDVALRSIEEDTARFYLLSYAPPSPRGDGSFHTIRVAVRRPDLTVRQRNGYVDLGPEERTARALRAALALPGAVDALPVDVRALRGWSAGGEPVIKLVVGLEQDLARQQIGPPDFFSHQVHAVALNEYGALVGELNQQMQLSGSTSRRIRSGERPAVYVHDWALPAGTFDVRVAVRDNADGEIGAARLDVDVPAPSAAWSASDLMLAATDEHGVAQPLLAGWVYRDEPLLAYVEVKGGTAPALSGRILDAGGVERLIDLPATPLVADGAGVHRGALRLRNLPSGDYLLEVELVDREAGQQRSYRVPLQVLDS